MKMLKSLLALFFILIFSPSFAQTTLKGKVVDEKGQGLPGANVSLKGSYDGATADGDGNFQFKTSEKGEHDLACSFVGYEAYNQRVILKSELLELTLKMKESANELNTVTVTAGTFEASDEKKTTLIKPIDIVTTAGGGADITQTMTLLTPGSQRNGESTGMFVRGGSAQESKILFDGSKCLQLTLARCGFSFTFCPFSVQRFCLFNGRIFSSIWSGIVGNFANEYDRFSH
jgi:hypothetical protein